MNNTSIKAYHKVKPTIPQKEREVLALIKLYGPINGRQIDVKINGGHKRTHNLLALGCIDVAYIAQDAVTGHQATYYMYVTDKPKAVAKKENKPCPMKLSSFYDEAYKSGVRATVCYSLDKSGQNATIEDIEAVVNEVCEVML